MELTYREIGDVIADEASPSFDLFRFKALSSEYVFPGTLVGTWISKTQFLIGRISSSLETKLPPTNVGGFVKLVGKCRLKFIR